MIRRTYRVLLQIFAGLCTGLALALVFLVWRLNAGPVAIDFLDASIESALNADDAPYRVTVGETVLIWAGWERNVDVRVRNVQVVTAQGDTLAAVPELAVSFSARALLRGVVAPRSIEIHRPSLRLARRPDGRFVLGLSGGDSEGLVTRAAAILSAPTSDPDQPLSYLNRLAIVDANLTLLDEAEDWRLDIPMPRLEINRTAGGLGASGQIALPLEGSAAILQVTAAYRPDEEPITVSARFTDIDPGALGRAVPPLNVLSAADFRASGTLSVIADLDGTLKLARLDVQAGEGSLALVGQGSTRFAFRSFAAQADLNAAGAWDGEADLRLAGGDGQGRMTVAFTRQPRVTRVDLAVDLVDVVLAQLTAVAIKAAPLAALAVPFSGTLTASVDAGVLDGIGFDITGAAGQLAPPWAAAAPVPVKAAALRGRVEGHFERIVVDTATLDFAGGAEILVPGSRQHRSPIRSVLVQGTYDVAGDRLAVSAFKLDLGGPRVDMAVQADGLRGKAKVGGRIAIHDVPVSEAKRYWPAGWGDDARNWVTAHMADGTMRRVEATFDLLVNDPASLNITRVDGVMTLESASIDYLSPMPKARKVSATARFDHKHFNIDLTSGEVEGLKVPQGKIIFSDLDKRDQYTFIDLLIDGPFSEAMRLIDHEPLGFASRIGVTPAQTGGWASTRLKLKFIAEKALTFDEVEVSAHAELRDVVIENAVRDLDISGGHFALDIDKVGMDVKGRIRLGTMAGELSWRENFKDNAPYRSRYDVQGQVDRQQRQTELGLDFPPFSGSTIDGSANTRLRHTVFTDGRALMEAEVDLTATAIDLAPLTWSKVAGVPSKAEVLLEVSRGGLTAVPRFSLTAADLSIIGRIAFAPTTGAIEGVRFDTMRFGRTDMTGRVHRQVDGRVQAEFSGPSFDMSTLLGNNLKSHTGDDDSYKGPPLDLSAKFDMAWLDAERQLSAVDGNLSNDGERWTSIDLRGRFEEGRIFAVNLEPAAPGKRRLKITSGDAGAALRGLDIYDNMIGGDLDIAGEYDDSQSHSPLAGKVVIGDFRVVRAPALVQLLSIMALTGVLDALQGGGLGFNALDATFTMADGVIHIADGRAAGTSIGFTASGQVDTRKDTINLEGTVVPVYAINSLLGRLPLVGGLFTGGEKGGGIFAANYTMTGETEKPDIRVNPLSALAPGFLRRLFGIFDGLEPSPDGTPVEPQERN